MQLHTIFISAIENVLFAASQGIVVTRPRMPVQPRLFPAIRSILSIAVCGISLLAVSGCQSYSPYGYGNGCSPVSGCPSPSMQPPTYVPQGAPITPTPANPSGPMYPQGSTGGSTSAPPYNPRTFDSFGE